MYGANNMFHISSGYANETCSPAERDVSRTPKTYQGHIGIQAFQPWKRKSSINDELEFGCFKLYFKLWLAFTHAFGFIVQKCHILINAELKAVSNII